MQTLANATALALENVQVYAELEQRVQDRTAALEFMTAKLQIEVLERQAAEADVQKLSLTDELTGLHNRRGFLLMAKQQLKLAHRMNTSVCLLFIDLDGLKRVNDSYGHEMGDRLLKAAGQVLQQTFRETDVVARLGGDEFAVFIPGCTKTDKGLERLQENVSRFNQLCEGSYRLSMSIDASMCQVDKETTIEEMMTQADTFIYAHKRSKRTAEVRLEP